MAQFELHRTGTSPVTEWSVRFRTVDSTASSPRLESTRNHSGWSFCAVSACRYVFLSAVALVAASLTLLATTEQRVRQSGS